MPDEFHFKHAEIASSAGSNGSAIYSLNKYLVSAGREGAFYQEALELLDELEVAEIEERKGELEARERRLGAERMVEAARVALETARGAGSVNSLEDYLRKQGDVPEASHLTREAEELLRELKTKLHLARARRAVTAMRFERVPAGEFRMGSKSKLADSDEQPLTRVRLSKGFLIGKFEVTQDEWEAVMGSNPSRFRSCGKDCPVENVSWDDVREFIEKLNQIGEGKYRLPTEAEWEYAARGLAKGNRNSQVLSATGWFDGNSGGRTHSVGSRAANEYGLHDMLGNVWEWVQDRYGDYPGGTVTDPTGLDPGLYRVSRGGDWGTAAGYCTVSNRNARQPNFRSNQHGFRLVKTE